MSDRTGHRDGGRARKTRRTLGETRLLALAVLQRSGPMSASNLGLELWGRPDGSRKPQHFALPAGRVLRSLLTDGLVEQIWTETHTLWGYLGP